MLTLRDSLWQVVIYMNIHNLRLKSTYEASQMIHTISLLNYPTFHFSQAFQKEFKKIFRADKVRKYC